MTEITQVFVYKVLPDLLGVPVAGREHMYAFGNMVWATMGPMNELFHEAMQDTGPVIEWAGSCIESKNLAPDSLGMQMYLAADRGEITQDEAQLLIGILLSAAADTTVITPGECHQGLLLIPGPVPARPCEPVPGACFLRESLRWDSPSRMAGRIAMRDVEIEGVVIPAGERCGLMFAAANRDPRKWSDPDRFDVERDNRGHLAGAMECIRASAESSPAWRRTRCWVPSSSTSRVSSPRASRNPG